MRHFFGIALTFFILFAQFGISQNVIGSKDLR